MMMKGNEKKRLPSLKFILCLNTWVLGIGNYKFSADGIFYSHPPFKNGMS